ncbi:MAG: hypothetical protein JXR60_03540 [Bacteroidales bacterium]|nr:hypothetical protein [Bacteroidales bacterium]
MKINEVPQDNANMLEGKTKEIQYALDENGNYQQVKSVGWEPKNIVMQQAWDEVNENIANALKEVKKGAKSPIYYFMHKNIMDLKILSEYTGFWKISIKKHFNPQHFNKLKPEQLQKYVEAFRLTSIKELTEFNAEQI